jgi:hypothetical protein
MKTFPISRSLSRLSHLAFALRLAAVAAAGASLGGCGAGDEEDHGSPAAAGTSGSGGSGAAGAGGSGNAAGTSGSGGSTASECETRVATAVAIDQEIYHSGLRVTLGDALVTPVTAECPRGKVVIDAEFYNRGTTVYSLNTRVLLTSDGHDYPVSDSESDFPDVEGERAASGTLVFNTDEDFVLDNATLLFGTATQHKAIVPVGAASPDALVTLHPQELAVAGPVEVGHFRFDVKSALVRADVPWEHDTLDDQTLFLSIYFDATMIVGNSLGENVLSRNFQLHLPDGTSIAAEDTPNELFYTAGTTIADLNVTFEIPKASGQYGIEFGGNWIPGESGYVGGTLNFDIQLAETLAP